MYKHSSHPLRDRARALRRNQTETEQRLWRQLRSRQLRGYKFRRQYPIGAFIVDFCCLEKKLVVELDGGQHDDNKQKDERRSRWLRQQGYKVLRFWNNDVMNESEAVLHTIAEALEEPSR